MTVVRGLVEVEVVQFLGSIDSKEAPNLKVIITSSLHHKNTGKCFCFIFPVKMISFAEIDKSSIFVFTYCYCPSASLSSNKPFLTI